jgi:hypothetical protein
METWAKIVRIWNWLVVLTILKNDGVRQWGWDFPIYEMESNPNIWNHQPGKRIVGIWTLSTAKVDEGKGWIIKTGDFGGNGADGSNVDELGTSRDFTHSILQKRLVSTNMVIQIHLWDSLGYIGYLEIATEFRHQPDRTNQISAKVATTHHVGFWKLIGMKTDSDWLFACQSHFLRLQTYLWLAMCVCEPMITQFMAVGPRLPQVLTRISCSNKTSENLSEAVKDKKN